MRSCSRFSLSSAKKSRVRKREIEKRKTENEIENTLKHSASRRDELEKLIRISNEVQASLVLFSLWLCWDRGMTEEKYKKSNLSLGSVCFFCVAAANTQPTYDVFAHILKRPVSFLNSHFVLIKSLICLYSYVNYSQPVFTLILVYENYPKKQQTIVDDVRDAQPIFCVLIVTLIRIFQRARKEFVMTRCIVRYDD